MKSGYISYAKEDSNLSERFEKAYDVLREINITDYKDGQYEINEDRYFYG